jgi:hypothetical protein
MNTLSSNPSTAKKKKKKVSEVKGGMNTNLNEFKENINK